MSNVKSSLQVVKEIAVGVVVIIVIGILAAFALFKYGVPALERYQDRRYIERQYEREEYRKELEAKYQSEQKKES